MNYPLIRERKHIGRYLRSILLQDFERVTIRGFIIGFIINSLFIFVYLFLYRMGLPVDPNIAMLMHLFAISISQRYTILFKVFLAVYYLAFLIIVFGYPFPGIITLEYGIWAIIVLFRGKLVRDWLVLKEMKCSKELEERKAEVQILDRRLAIASHDIRTPITTLKLYAQLIARKHHDHLTTRLTAELARLSLLIDELFDYTKLKNGTLTLHKEVFDLDLLIKERLKELAITYGISHTTYKNTATVTMLYADKLCIDRIITNLISNAMKHADTKGIEVQLGTKKHKEFVLVVKNGGKLIPKLIQGKIFSAFIQGDSTTGGLGLGLYITHQLVKLHHGTIAFTSRGKTTRFTINLPHQPKTS